MIKVGSDVRPAGQEDINDITKLFEEVLNKSKVNCEMIVTHHALDITVY